MLKLFRKCTKQRDRYGKKIYVGDSLVEATDFEYNEPKDWDVYTVYNSDKYPGAFWFTTKTKEYCDNYGCGDEEELFWNNRARDYIIINKTK